MSVAQKVLLFPKAANNLNEGDSRYLSVISVGNDPSLLNLREQIIIRTTGLGVQSVTPAEAIRIARSGMPCLWVFCSTLELEELIGTASLVRRCSPQSRLVLLEGPETVGAEAALFHCIVDPVRSIDTMLTAIKQLAGGGIHCSEQERQKTFFQM